MPAYDYIERKPTRLKKLVRRSALIVGSVLGGVACATAGYLAPHVQAKPEVKTVVEKVKVYSDPDSPMIVNSVGIWRFYREKTSGCIWMEQGGVDKTSYWATVYLPDKNCTNFEVPGGK